MKYPIPCGGARLPSDDVLDELGLAPDDRVVFQSAYESSAKRLHDALLPLCAVALGHRMDLAGAMGVDSCRLVIISTSRTRNEDPSQSAQRVAAFMAGEGPRPTPSGSLTERAFLALAEESGLFEDDLAQAFGPEEAHRLVYSDRLCFSSGTHQLTAGPAAPGSRASTAAVVGMAAAAPIAGAGKRASRSPDVGSGERGRANERPGTPC